MLACFAVLGLEVRLVEAVDGRMLEPADLNAIGVKQMPDYRDPYHKRPMTLGEVGCFLSHYNVWRDMLDRGYRRAVIFEDDLRFTRSFRRQVGVVMAELDANVPDWDLVYLGRKRLNPDQDGPLVENCSFVSHVGYSYWTLAYALSRSFSRHPSGIMVFFYIWYYELFVVVFLFDKFPCAYFIWNISNNAAEGNGKEKEEALNSSCLSVFFELCKYFITESFARSGLGGGGAVEAAGAGRRILADDVQPTSGDEVDVALRATRFESLHRRAVACISGALFWRRRLHQRHREHWHCWTATAAAAAAADFAHTGNVSQHRATRRRTLNDQPTSKLYLLLGWKLIASSQRIERAICILSQSSSFDPCFFAFPIDTD
ncbi:glycosyltransferase 25 family member 1 [Trichinella spiralis]|uniref:glycosyltransferase 25 family member 1 n=1 Tax=Trichinella spiralis TaxID=6334 RepID=UPI0001EFC8B7|nr:glycosyltransferase 25 family member 1 [Trichinella spiralis]